MSDIDQVMMTSSQSAPASKPSERLGDRFDAAPPTSKPELVVDPSETRPAKSAAFAAKSTPSAGRPPLFRR